MPEGMRVAFYAARIAALGEQAEQRGVTALTTEYSNEVKTMMRDSPASGRIYRGKGKRAHQASAPGEPPAPDTGDLLRSIVFRIRKTDFGWIGEVGSRLRYALYLEYGAAKGRRDQSGKLQGVQWILFPRPVWGPAMGNIRRRAREILRRAGLGMRVS